MNEARSRLRGGWSVSLTLESLGVSLDSLLLEIANELKGDTNSKSTARFVRCCDRCIV